MTDTRKIGTIILCECGRIKGQHGWLDVDKTNLAILISKANEVINDECDVCEKIRERLAMLRNASEGCSSCGQQSWEKI